MARKATFGRLLRVYRKGARRSMGELAQHLGLSVSYVSDVERGLRQPWRYDQVLAAAHFLQVEPTNLLRAAASSRGAFELDANVTDRGREVGASLSREWGGFTNSEFDELAELLKKFRARQKKDEE